MSSGTGYSSTISSTGTPTVSTAGASDVIDREYGSLLSSIGDVLHLHKDAKHAREPIEDFVGASAWTHPGLSINDAYPKLVLSMDRMPIGARDGVRHQFIPDFLLDPKWRSS